VLYFTDLSSDHQLQPVADGLTEALIGALSEVSALRVVSRNGVAPYRNPDIPRDSVARALSAGTLVVGSVEPEGKDRVKVSTRLLDRSGGDLNKHTSFVVSRDSLFSASQSVAQEVSRTLREWLGDEVRLKETQGGTRNLAAWSLFNRAETGRKAAEEASRADPAKGAALLLQSDSLLEQAEAADRNWIDPALLRGDIAYSLAQLEDTKEGRVKWVQKGLDHAEAALKLDPASAKAQALRGTLRYAQWRLSLGTDPVARKSLLDEAQKDLEGAVQKDATLASAYATLSALYYDRQDVPTALSRARSAYAADAFLINADRILFRLFWASYDLAQFSEADKWCGEGGRRFPRDYNFTACRLWLQLNPNSTPDIAEAWRLAARVDSLAPAKDKTFQSHLTQMLVGGIIGKSVRPKGGVARGPLADSADAVIKRARADALTDPGQELPGYEAVMRAQMGQTDEAISLLKRYVALNPDHSFEVGDNVHWWWRDLVNQPAFQSLMSQRR
jgi:TolB-like protein